MDLGAQADHIMKIIENENRKKLQGNKEKNLVEHEGNGKTNRSLYAWNGL